MTPLTASQTISALESRLSLTLAQGGLVQASTWEELNRSFRPEYHRHRIHSLAAYVLSQIEQNRPQALEMGEALIQRYRGLWFVDSACQLIDRVMGQHRSDHSFIYQANERARQKWVYRNKFPEEIFLYHRDFCDFLEQSRLASQLKITRDTPLMRDGHPGLIVEGNFMPWSSIKEKFHTAHSPRFNETFLMHKQLRYVYTYLDNGKGLQKHHPYIDINPIRRLDDQELESLQASAATFERVDGSTADRPHVLQLITSRISGSNWNIDVLLRQSKHPYVRMILGHAVPELELEKGDVLEVGYGWRKRPLMPYSSDAGQFRCPDVWSMAPCEEKVITNISASTEEILKHHEFVMKYHREGVQLGKLVGFNLLIQNCSVFARMSLEAAGISIPTQITIPDLLFACLPTRIQEIGHSIQKGRHAIRSSIRPYVPDAVANTYQRVLQTVSQLAGRILQTLLALSLSPARAVAGGAFGQGGLELRHLDQEEEVRLTPPTRSFWNLFRLSSFDVNLPGVMQAWQREQRSTVVYSKPIRLPITPVE